MGGAMWAHARRATAARGARGSARTGVMYFPGLSNLKGKIINSVKITVTNRAGGQNAQKTAHFFRSASQGGINTSLGAGHKTGNQIGTLSGWFHAYAAASLSFTPTFFSSYIAAGEDTFCIYSATASEYLVWGVVTLEVAWQEPATQPTLSEATVEMGKSVTINTPAVKSAPTGIRCAMRSAKRRARSRRTLRAARAGRRRYHSRAGYPDALRVLALFTVIRTAAAHCSVRSRSASRSRYQAALCLRPESLPQPSRRTPAARGSSCAAWAKPP